LIGKHGQEPPNGDCDAIYNFRWREARKFLGGGSSSRDGFLAPVDLGGVAVHCRFLKGLLYCIVAFPGFIGIFLPSEELKYLFLINIYSGSATGRSNSFPFCEDSLH
jgi:hypothetical protein